jgi:hypothetical protein
MKRNADPCVASKQKRLGNEMGWSCILKEFMGNKRPNWLRTPGIWVFFLHCTQEFKREYVVVDKCQCLTKFLVKFV